jgi:hypothetical protein
MSLRVIFFLIAMPWLGYPAVGREEAKVVLLITSGSGRPKNIRIRIPNTPCFLTLHLHVPRIVRVGGDGGSAGGEAVPGRQLCRHLHPQRGDLPHHHTQLRHGARLGCRALWRHRRPIHRPFRSNFFVIH